MILPRTRLLVWFALVVVPFATLAGVVPGTAAFGGAAIGLFLLIAVLDALLAAHWLRDVSIELTPLIRATQGRMFSINVRVRNPARRAKELRLTLAFPPEVVPTAEEITTRLPAESEWSAFDWSGTGNSRGKFFIQTARGEATSPLGFWSRWRDWSVASELRVYPSLAQDRNSLAALFLNRGAFGIHAQRQVGRGRDFEKLRDYIPGDSLEDIHWKATAKRGRPVTKVYQIERTQEVYVILDASRLSGRKVSSSEFRVTGSTRAGTQLETPNSKLETTSLERFITSALVLALAAEQQGDLFGLVTFSDKVGTFLRARSGTAHFHACRDALHTLQAREVAPDFEELSTFLRLRLRRRALIIFLTSLDDPVAAESFVKSLDLVSRQHLVLVNVLQPPGVRPMFSNENVTNARELYGELAGHLRWHGLRELEKVLQRRGVKLSLLSGEQLAVDLVSQYVNVKRRQVL